MKLKRYLSTATPSGKSYQPKMQPGTLSRAFAGLAELGESVSQVGKIIYEREKRQLEIEDANNAQKISSEMAIDLKSVYNEEALNKDHKTLTKRYRTRAEEIRDRVLEGINRESVKAAVLNNYYQYFSRHMARMDDLSIQYWRDNNTTSLKESLMNFSRAAINEIDPALYAHHLKGALTQIEANKEKGVITDQAALDLKKQFLHDVEYGKLMGLVDANPLEAYKALKRGEFEHIDTNVRSNYLLHAKNKFYESVSRDNAESERQFKLWDRKRKLKEQATFSTFIVKAREGKLTDAEVKYAQRKGWLDGDKLKAVYKFKDEHDIAKVGDDEKYYDFKVSIAAGRHISESDIINSYLHDVINGKQAADLLDDLNKSAYTSDAYQWGSRELDKTFFKGPFDFGVSTARKMRRLAFQEYRERVIDKGEDAVHVATELLNRYEDWRKKRKSGELLPINIQEDPTLIERLYKNGSIGKYTYYSWKILLQQIDVAGRVTAEEAVQTRTGGKQ